MEWLNYHHLLYFWTVVREGGVSRAAEKLRLAQPTVSAQIKLLEDVLGEQLFERRGRRLVPTDVGRLVYRYADEIFLVGRELLETLKGRPASGRPLPLTVGVANAVPKLIVHRLLQPVMSGEPAIRLTCREDSTETLLGELATHALDVVIADEPAPPHVSGQGVQSPAGRIRHLVLRRRAAGAEAEAALSVVTERHAHPAADASHRAAAVDRSVAERGGSASADLRRVRRLGADEGLWTGRHGGLSRPLGHRTRGRAAVQGPGHRPRLGDRERYFAISAERRVKHPGVIAITNAARHDVLP